MIQLHAGAAALSIGPDGPQWLDGYGNRTAPSAGAYQELTVKALALREGDTRAVLVAAEVLGFDRRRTAALKSAISARTGAPPASVILTATHTHCAPRVCDMVMPGEVDPAYVTWFEEQCVEVAAAASAALAPARMLFSRVRDNELGVNRRVWTGDATLMRPNPDGPRDADVDTLWFEAEDRVIATVTVAACHPTCRGGDLMGGDYPGFLVRELEGAVGGVGLFVLGCAGDVRPRFTDTDGRFRVAELAEVARAGRHLAAQVLSGRGSCRTLGPGALAVHRVVADMPLAEAPAEGELRRVASDDGSVLRRQWATGLLRAEGAVPESVPFEMQALLLGSCLTMVFWPGEVAADYALWLKSRLREGVVMAGATRTEP